MHNDSSSPDFKGGDETPGPNPSGIVNAEELEGLTLYEKKCVLINREIDNNGMARYQWCIFFLCGFGYFLDLLWAQAFGLVLSPLEQELGFPANKSGNISVGTLDYMHFSSLGREDLLLT